MLKKLYEHPHYLSSIMEHIMAALVLVGIVIATLSLKESFAEFWHHRMMGGAFLEYIESIFNIVIGIEFFKLLWRPGKETLLEVLMFVLARHMIIGHNTSIDNLLSVVAIAILFVIERYLLHFPGHKEEEDHEDTLFDH